MIYERVSCGILHKEVWYCDAVVNIFIEKYSFTEPIMRIAVIGSGSWGTALAHILSKASHEISLWTRNEEVANEINTSHSNSRYLKGFTLDEHIFASTKPEEVLGNAEILLLTTPVQYSRDILRKLAPCIPENAIPICLSKGIEVETLKSMREVVAEELPAQAPRYAVLSGPSFAEEVAAGKPAAVVIASENANLGASLQSILSVGFFRIYLSSDVRGVELGGAVKNVIALAAGLCDGRGYGDNARAALVTRGLAEMSRLGVALGGQALTFMGLSGMGDLVLTCTGALSRNRRMGLMLAQGIPFEEALSSIGHVVEGVKTTEAVCQLGKKYGVELPIAETMLAVMQGKVQAQTAVDILMKRSLKEE